MDNLTMKQPGPQTHLTGPSYGPVSGEQPKNLVVLLHGYGANGNDLMELGKQWAPILPQTLFVAPDAPFACEVNPFGYQWFGLQDFDGERILQEIEQTVIPFLGEFLQTIKDAYHLEWNQIILVGFSQGTMLALASGLSSFPVGGVLGYSGVFPEAFGSHIKYSPPICLVHGDQDEVIPLKSFDASVETLRRAGLKLEHIVYQGVGHAICPSGFTKGLGFLKGCLDVS